MSIDRAAAAGLLAQPARTPDPELATELKVAALRRREAYPEHPPSIEVLETHMSWVFLTAEHVYKLKKPVRYDRLDFTTLERRHFYCLEELRLNRRLARGVYLDVVALSMDPRGTLRIGADGGVVDWLVKMRRLPARLMLDSLLENRTATPWHLRAVARRLADFHGALPAAIVEARPYLEHLAREIDGFEADLCEPLFELPVAQVLGVCARLRSVLAGRAALFESRVRAGHVVEGHGDLRPEHVYLGAPVAIIDCLEFSAELRTVDAADELAFLALECERLGAPGLGQVLLRAYREASGDQLDVTLVEFYQAYRACSRARIAIVHLLEAQYRGSSKWQARARHYLDLATRHAAAAVR